ncbi:MAG: amidohydrolase family protein [Pseudothermotoga sp.]
MKIVCGTLLTPLEEINGATVVIENRKIVSITTSNYSSEQSDLIDAKQYYVVPGFIDPHTHIGIYRLEGENTDHGFELTDPITPHLDVVDGLDLYDPAFDEALMAGITTVGVLPGSYMSFGSSVERITIMPGQGAIYKTNKRLLKESAFVKAALGEHPKRFLLEQKLPPTTRMGIVSQIRSILMQTKRYMKSVDREFNPKLEALIPLLEKRIPLRVHAHTVRDILVAKRLAEEFDINIVLDHATEFYEVKEQMKDVPVVYGPIVFAQRGTELRNLDVSNLSKMGDANFCLTTDHPTIPIQYLDLIAGLSMAEGFSMSKALALITINAAKVLGVDERVGSVEIGKDADLVVLSGKPFEPDTKVVCTIVDGQVFWGNRR